VYARLGHIEAVLTGAPSANNDDQEEEAGLVGKVHQLMAEVRHQGTVMNLLLKKVSCRSPGTVVQPFVLYYRLSVSVVLS
jgi:hypothetical protein